MPEFIVFKPTVPPRTGARRLAPRPRTLDGKTVGLLWNSKVNADVYLERVRELIEEKYRGTHVLFRGKATASRAMEAEVFQALRGVDAVVNAFGD